MNIGIIGGGNLGAALARLAASAGHDVVVGRRQPDSELHELKTDTIDAACERGDIVVLALPCLACATVLPRLSSLLAGKIVIDATNPLNPDWSPVAFGGDNSAAEEIARMLPGARIVKAFNTVFADVMVEERLVRGDHRRATAFIAGDDTDAVARVFELAHSLGFEPLSVGGLVSARYLEAMAHLNIAIAVGCGGGTDACFIYDQGRP
jgi:8-hydroxy-5-deazaflavin:NADPH oxidoreductase